MLIAEDCTLLSSGINGSRRGDCAMISSVPLNTMLFSLPPFWSASASIAERTREWRELEVMSSVMGDSLRAGASGKVAMMARKRKWRNRQEKRNGSFFRAVSEISMVIIRGGEEGRAVDSSEDSGIKKERRKRAVGSTARHPSTS